MIQAFITIRILDIIDVLLVAYLMYQVYLLIRVAERLTQEDRFDPEQSSPLSLVKVANRQVVTKKKKKKEDETGGEEGEAATTPAE